MAQRYEDDDRFMRSHRREDDDDRGPWAGDRGGLREQPWRGASDRDRHDDGFGDSGRSAGRRGQGGRWSGEDDDRAPRGDWSDAGGRGGAGLQGRYDARDGRHERRGFDRPGGSYAAGNRDAQGLGEGYRPGQGPQGRGLGHDPHYHSWRDRQLQAYDEDFKAFNEERQKKFDAEFEEWRNKRNASGAGQDNSGPASGSQRGGRSADANPRDEPSAAGKKG